MAHRITTYLKETRAELTHVKWLSRRQTVQYTALVVVLSLAVAAFLGLFDLLFSFLIKTFIL